MNRRQEISQSTDPRSPGFIAKYDDLVRSSPQGSIYCHRWWLDAVAPGRWRILQVHCGDQLAAAWPVVFQEDGPHLRVKMPQMTQKLGILFAPTEAKYSEALSREHELAGELIEQLPPLRSFSHNFHEGFTNWLPFYWRGYEQTTKYTYVIEPLADLGAVWEETRSLARRQIRKAMKGGVRVEDDLSLDEFLDINERTFLRQGIRFPVEREVVHRVDEACRRHAQRRIFAARDSQGRLHAALYLAWADGTAYYLMAGADPELRSSGAPMLVFWEAIRFSATVANRFDFEGSMIPGVESTIRALGGRQRPYFSITQARAVAPEIGTRTVVQRAFSKAKHVLRRFSSPNGDGRQRDAEGRR